ncbi:hypothetical protein Dimus_002647, partial [Dionaea muscipula]
MVRLGLVRDSMLGEVCGSFVSEGSPEEVHSEFSFGEGDTDGYGYGFGEGRGIPVVPVFSSTESSCLPLDGRRGPVVFLLCIIHGTGFRCFHSMCVRGGWFFMGALVLISWHRSPDSISACCLELGGRSVADFLGAFSTSSSLGGLLSGFIESWVFGALVWRSPEFLHVLSTPGSL